MKNSLKTYSYFVKRLKDNGYETWKMMDKYSEADPRKFTVLIDPFGASVYCTCFENLEGVGDVHFEFYDGGQQFRNSLKIKTDSFEVILKHLNDHNIVRKFGSPDSINN